MPTRGLMPADLALATAMERIWEEAGAIGLRPFATHFELVPTSILYEVGSYLMPGRFSHWSYGKMYHVQKMMYDYGLSKIYELVINTDPCWAFLLDANTLLQNKLVAAHVLGHSDFFANNAYFAKTSRRMLDTVTLNADRLRRYEYAHGQGTVEAVLDACLAIQMHVTPYMADDVSESRTAEAAGAEGERETAPVHLRGPYADLWALDQPADDETPKGPDRALATNHDRDLLRFIATHAPALTDWERDAVQIVRGESLYFFPQMQTKIVNEGWATLCHATILHRLDLDPQEYLDFADLHSGVVQPSRRQINPYHLGFGILRELNRRHGGDEEHIAAPLLDLRETECDLSLIRNYLDEELVESLDLYVYGPEAGDLVVT
ncbi:MAG: SpoVR family protein, partial [Rubrobacter sp.]|nr:SpoVR family protein [Rubrobacter sp.]